MRTAAEYMRAAERIMERLEEVTGSLLIYHSENDTMTDPSGSKELFLKAKVRGGWEGDVREGGAGEIMLQQSRCR